MGNEVDVIGYGSPNTVRDYLKSGAMSASILWDPEALGYINVWAGIQLLEGKPFQAVNDVPGHGQSEYFDDIKLLLLGPPLVITTDNVDDFNF